MVIEFRGSPQCKFWIYTYHVMEIGEELQINTHETRVPKNESVSDSNRVKKFHARSMYVNNYLHAN